MRTLCGAREAAAPVAASAYGITITTGAPRRSGATLSYDVEGEGPTVLQAHGLTSGRTADLDLLDLRLLAARGVTPEPQLQPATAPAG